MHGQYQLRHSRKYLISIWGRGPKPGQEGNWPTKYYTCGSGFPLFAPKLEAVAKRGEIIM